MASHPCAALARAASSLGSGRTAAAVLDRSAGIHKTVNTAGFSRVSAPPRPLAVLRASAGSAMTTMETGTELRDARLASDAAVWAAQNGLVMGYSGATDGKVMGSGVQVVMAHAPVSLTPTPMPREEFERAVALAADFNDLMLAVSRDRAFLRSTVRRAAEFDAFTEQLVDLMGRVEGARGAGDDPVTVMINRSDYMLDAPSGRLLQVEINMIAASFAALSAKTSELHRYLASRDPDNLLPPRSSLPSNGALDGLASALATAAAAYCSHKGWEEPRVGSRLDLSCPAALMVVQPGEMNAFDQQWLCTTLWEKHGIDTIRRTLAEVEAEATVSEDGSLSVGGRRVCVVYLRSGYAPGDYPSQAEWDGRCVLETSDAPKCPNLPMQIAGAKRIQQELAMPGVTERFVSADAVSRLRAVYAGQWALEREGEVAEVVRRAIEHPDDYVLKPQREGGGNNVYGADIAARLRAGGSDLAQYILMERIRPPVNRTLFLRNGRHFWSDSLSELGVYGVCVEARGKGSLMNAAAGHLLRTKTADSNEGGVASGFAVLDSPAMQ